MKPLIQFETFRRFTPFNQQQFTQTQPDCFNGEVAIKKYRITVEEIPEPKNVLIARLGELWQKCDNHHHYAPLRAVGKSLGVELNSSALPKRS